MPNSGNPEIIMPVAAPDALEMANIHALRQISDALTLTNRSLSSLAADVKDVRERVIKIEAKDMDAKIAEYRSECRTICATLTSDLKAVVGRVDSLESARDRQTGMASVGSWFSRSAPWIIAVGAAVLAALGFKQA